MELFDTHFHYYGDRSPAAFMAALRADADEAAKRGAPGDVRFRLAAVGADFSETLRAREFAEAIPECAGFTAGVHPHQAEAFLAEQSDFSAFRDDPRLLAVGEIGLDYFYGLSGREAQRKVFGTFLQLALEWRRPAVIHLRDEGDGSACADAEGPLRDFAGAGGRFVVHCFSGTSEQAETFLALGGYLGVTGMATFRRAENIRRTLKCIPADRLLLETDSPYLAPVPFRGRDNSPGLLGLIAASVAETRGVEVERLVAETTANAFKFYGLEPES